MNKRNKENKQYGLDLTEGSVQKILLRFAWPFLVSGIITALYGAVDMFVISFFTTEEIIAGVSTGTMVTTIVYTFIIGISTGGTVLVGRKIGEKDDEGCAKASGTLMTVGLILGIVLMIALFATVEPLLRVLRTPEPAMPSARVYVRLATIGVPFQVGFNVISAIARGLGNSTVPSIIGALGAVLNIVLDIVLVAVFGMAEDGVAIATSVSQIATLVIIGAWLLRKKFPFRFTKAHFRPHSPSVKSIIKVGVPLWLQELLIHISFLIIGAIINEMGVIASASVGLVNKIFNLGAIIPSAFGGAIAAVSAQNIGAGKRERALKAMGYGILYCFIIEAVLVAWAVIAPETITTLFAEGKAEVITGAAAHLRSFSLDLILLCAIFCINAHLNACGKASFTTIHSLVSTFAVRVPVSFLFARVGGDLYDTLFLLGFAAPLASLGSIIMVIPYLIWYEKRQKQPRLEA